MSVVRLDDRDPSISYTPPGNWGKSGSILESDVTTSYTLIAGSTVKIPFTGTQISIYGTISPNGSGGAPSSTYSIDDGPPQSFNGVQLNTVQYNQLFFRSPELSPSTHTLIVTSTSSTGYFWLDYAEFVSLPTANSTVGSLVSSSTVPGPTISNDSASDAAFTSVGPGSMVVIIGVFLGCLVASLLIIFLIWWIMRRRRRKAVEARTRPGKFGDSSSTASSGRGKYQIDPFNFDNERITLPRLTNVYSIASSSSSRLSSPCDIYGPSTLLYSTPIGARSTRSTSSTATSSSLGRTQGKRQLDSMIPSDPFAVGWIYIPPHWNK